MAAENENGQERTEEPTEKRIQKARTQGQVLRSKEMVTAAVLLGAVCALMFLKNMFGEGLGQVMRYCFTLERAFIFDSSKMLVSFAPLLEFIYLPMLIFFAVMFVFSVYGNTLLGGFNFSWEALKPKWNRISPVKGIKRIFGVQALVELIKSILKVILISVFCWFGLSQLVYRILSLSEVPYQIGTLEALELLLWIALILASSMLPILMIDIPFQKWQYTKQLKMTLQEVKDEFKDTEGQPEVKRRIRQAQIEMSKRRMMANVPQADVVITNPTHYAVALRYDAERKGAAPVVIAKGEDLLALKMMEIARNHGVHVIQSPVLARSIYYTTDMDEEIPEGLYLAVAQVLAYIYQLNEFQKGRSRRPKPLAKELPIPEELQH